MGCFAVGSRELVGSRACLEFGAWCLEFRFLTQAGDSPDKPLADIVPLRQTFVVSKKRASKPAPVASGLRRRAGSKWEPAYWRQRLFKNTYTHNRRRYQVRNWCVKIQHQGRRKTLSLYSSDAARAAAEACAVYRRIITEGWDKADAAGKLNLRNIDRPSAVPLNDAPERWDSG